MRKLSAIGTVRRKRSRHRSFCRNAMPSRLPTAGTRSAAVAYGFGTRVSGCVQPAADRRRTLSCSRTSTCELLFLFKVSLFGTWLVDTLSKTSPMGSVIRAFDLDSGYQLCQGGSFNLARGLMEAFIAAGGTFQPKVSIDRIVIENGRATGIELRGGGTVRATQFVASNARRAPDF